MCYIEPFYIGFTSEQNKTVEHAVAKSYDDIHDIFIVPCQKSKMTSFASSVAPTSRSTISFKIFWDFSMFYQIFLSLQVNRSAIITYKHGIYELPHELPNNLRLRILGN